MFDSLRRLPTEGHWTEGRGGVACGLMLTSGRGFFSRVIQAASRSSVSHVGCVAMDPDGRWRVLESTTMRDDQPSGVQLNVLDEIVALKKSTVWVRPIVPAFASPEAETYPLAARQHVWRITDALFKAWDDRPYERNLLELARSAIDLGIPQVGNDGSLFCSELAAHWLAALGVIELPKPTRSGRLKGKAAAEYTPADYGRTRGGVQWLRPQPRRLLACG